MDKYENLKQALYEVKVLKFSCRKTAAKYGFEETVLARYAKLPEKEIDEMVFLRRDERRVLKSYLKVLADSSWLITPEDIIDKAHENRQKRFSQSAARPSRKWLIKFLQEHNLNIYTNESSTEFISHHEIIAWHAEEVRLGMGSEWEYTEDLMDDQEENFLNHQSKCRVCIEDCDENLKTEINESIQSMILEVQLEVTLSPNFSNFICEDCQQNLLQFSSFRTQINRKQRKLSQFLHGIRTSGAVGHSRPILFSSNLETIVVKNEPPEDDDTEENFFHTSDLIPPEYLNTQFSTVSTKQEIQSPHYDIKLENFETVDDSQDWEGHSEYSYSQPLNNRPFKITPTSSTSVENYTTCPVCAKVYKKSYLSSHMRTHDRKTKFICDFCGKNFDKKTHLREHVMTHIPKEHRKKVLECSVCSRSFLSPRYLEKHHLRKHGLKIKKEIKCDCGKVFRYMSDLLSHKRNVHDRDKYSKICDTCGKILYNEGDLRRHIKVYHTEGGRGNFICSDCGKRFDDLRALNVHRKTHREKTIACDEPGCNKKFQTNAVLKNHKAQVHLKIRNFICDVEDCRKAFPDMKKLQRHVTVVHQKLKASCPVEGCEFMVGRRDYMKNHIKKHNELSPEEMQVFLKSVKHMNIMY